MNQEQVEHATKYYECFRSPLIRLQPRSKKPLSESGHWEEFDLHQWLTEEVEQNAGLIPVRHRLLVIDVDARHGGLELWKEFQVAHDLQDTAKVMTSEGGFHAYYKCEFFENLNKDFGSGAITLKHHGYVVAAGSIHPSGILYEWEDLDAEFAELPESFVEWIRGQKSRRKRQKEGRIISKGSFHGKCQALNFLDPCMGYEEWIRVGMALHSSGYGDEAFDVWVQWSAKCKEKFDLQVMEKSWKSFGDCDHPITLATLAWMARKA